MNFEKFGKYLLLEKLATGGMAEIYLAKTTGANGVNKFVAIKRILPQYSQNKEFIEMFQEEAKVSINLNHSNVVSIYDFGIENSQFYIVMEFVAGKNLRQFINELKKQNKAFKIEEAVYIIKEAAAGLDHAHRCADQKTGRPLNITHRDMSPQNIMLSYEGEAKVIDFGIAKQNDGDREETKAGTLKGKFAYMSPEQAEADQVDPRTDIFALGIILWELLANDRLFSGSNESVILRKVRDCVIQPIRKINPLVPSELERILHKSLAKDKNNRFQTAANFQKELNRFLNTNYPEFTPQDLSKKMIETFISSFNDDKEKLQKFASVEFSSQNESETKKDNSQSINEETPAENELLNTLSQNTDSSKIELAGLNDAKKELNKSILFNQNKPSTKTNTNSIKPNSKTQVNYNIKNQNQKTSVFTQLVLILIIAGSGYYAYLKNLIPIEIINQVTLILTQDKTQFTKPIKPPVQGKIELAAKTAVNVSIKSQPTGAQIIINGEDTYRTTPAIVSIPIGKISKIKLIKDNYYDYEIEKNFLQTESLDLTLQEKTKAAYLNVIVQNGGLNPVVTINGIRLSEKPPINRYSVAANTSIKIEVENPITKAKGEKIIQLNPTQEETVEIVLGSENK